MKSMQNYRRVLLGISLILLSTTMIFQCTQPSERNENNNNNGEVTVSEQDYQRERTELENDISGSIRDIDARLERLGNDLEEADEETRVEIENSRKQLREERDQLNESLREVRNSTADSWNDVEQEVSNAYNESKREIDEIGQSLDNLFNREVDVEVESNVNER